MKIIRAFFLSAFCILFWGTPHLAAADQNSASCTSTLHRSPYIVPWKVFTFNTNSYWRLADHNDHLAKQFFSCLSAFPRQTCPDDADATCVESPLIPMDVSLRQTAEDELKGIVMCKDVLKQGGCLTFNLNCLAAGGYVTGDNNNSTCVIND